jgi:hypothetical protein
LHGAQVRAGDGLLDEIDPCGLQCRDAPHRHRLVPGLVDVDAHAGAVAQHPLDGCHVAHVLVDGARSDLQLEDAVTPAIEHSKIHAADCEDCDKKDGMHDRIERDVELHGALTDEQRSRLLEISNKCPVHKTLTSEINIRTRLV